MAKEKKKNKSECSCGDDCDCGCGCGCGCNCKNWKGKCGCGGAVYGLGFIGSAIYYISSASGFWMGVLGFLKAIVWPAFVVYDLLKFLA